MEVNTKGDMLVGKYKKCPRCELNYILQEQEYCPICLAEMKLAPAEDDDLELCSICGKNLITVDQVMCEECEKKRSSIDDVVDDNDSDDEDKGLDDWDSTSPEQDALDNEESIDSPALDTPEGFTELDDLDDLDDFDDEEDEDDEYQGSDDDDDFDDIGDIDDIDIEDDDDEKVDDDDDDDDFLSKKSK